MVKLVARFSRPYNLLQVMHTEIERGTRDQSGAYSETSAAICACRRVPWHACRAFPRILCKFEAPSMSPATPRVCPPVSRAPLRALRRAVAACCVLMPPKSSTVPMSTSSTDTALVSDCNLCSASAHVRTLGTYVHVRQTQPQDALQHARCCNHPCHDTKPYVVRCSGSS